MFIAMKACVSPQGHDWQDTSFTTRAGSTPVACTREGCGEIGFRIDAKVVDHNAGLPGEELF